MYWVQIIDWYCAFLTLLIICIIECILVGWVYGTDCQYMGGTVP